MTFGSDISSMPYLYIRVEVECMVELSNSIYYIRSHMQIMKLIAFRHKVLLKFKSFKLGREAFLRLVKEVQALAVCYNCKSKMMADQASRHAENIARIVREHLNTSIGCDSGSGTAYFSVPLNNAIHVVPQKMRYLFDAFEAYFADLSMQTVEHTNKLVPKLLYHTPQNVFNSQSNNKWVLAMKASLRETLYGLTDGTEKEGREMNCTTCGKGGHMKNNSCTCESHPSFGCDRILEMDGPMLEGYNTEVEEEIVNTAEKKKRLKKEETSLRRKFAKKKKEKEDSGSSEGERGEREGLESELENEKLTPQFALVLLGRRKCL